MEETVSPPEGAAKLHFTYRGPDKRALKQGDLLAKEAIFRDLIARIHPYYVEDERVTHFQVLTQTCDLVRRSGGKCKARYLSIAAVRRLDVVIERAIEDFQHRLLIHGIPYCSSEHQIALRQLVERLLNNNDSEYFFLKACPDYGLSHDSCTFLPLSIALRAGEHYEKCLEAKVLELDEPFEAKLGWKVGNQYSRVGTIDYAPGVGISDKEFDALVDQTLNRYVRWVPQKRFRLFRDTAKLKLNAAAAADLEAIEGDVAAQVERQVKSRLESIVADVQRVLALTPDQATQVRNALNQNPLVQKAIDSGAGG